MTYVGYADTALVRMINAGDAEAFDNIWQRYAHPIRRHLRGILRNADAAEDILQETFFRLWTRSEQWDGRGTFKAWLFRIATNLALNHIRTLSRRKETPLETNLHNEDADGESLAPGWMIDSATPGPEAVLETSERMARLQGLVESLPEERRELLRLVYEAEMHVKEAAEALGIPEGTAKSRLHYTTKQLAHEWRNLENE